MQITYCTYWLWFCLLWSWQCSLMFHKFTNASEVIVHHHVMRSVNKSRDQISSSFDIVDKMSFISTNSCDHFSQTTNRAINVVVRKDWLNLLFVLFFFFFLFTSYHSPSWLLSPPGWKEPVPRSSAQQCARCSSS